MKPIDYLDELSFVRMGGSESEKKAAETIAKWIGELGYTAHFEEFDIDSFEPAFGTLIPLVPSGIEIKVRPVGLSADCDVEGEMYIMNAPEPELTKKEELAGKIVFIPNYPRRKWVKLLVESGAKAGIIVVQDHRERAVLKLSQETGRDFGAKIPLASVAFKYAMSLVRDDVERLRLQVSHKKFTATSRNVIAEILGETERSIVFTAHYDSTPSSPGAQDNAAGVAELIEVMRKISGKKFKRTIKFVFCGSEEMGLLGSKAYAASHIDELDKIDLVINLDVGGDPFMPIFARTLGMEDLKNYIDGILRQNGFPVKIEQNIYSSDGMPFSRHNVPSISLARGSIDGKGHSPFDSADKTCNRGLMEIADVAKIIAQNIANAEFIPFKRNISDELKKKIEEYFVERG